MAQIPNGRLVKGPYKPICRNCAMYFSTTVGMKEYPSQKHPKAVLGNLYIHDGQNRQRTQLVNGSKGISLAFQVGVLHNSIQKLGSY